MHVVTVPRASDANISSVPTLCEKVMLRAAASLQMWSSGYQRSATAHRPGGASACPSQISRVVWLDHTGGRLPRPVHPALLRGVPSSGDDPPPDSGSSR